MENTETTVKKQNPYRFKKGVCPNPNGRPKGSYAIHTTLMEAIKHVEQEKKISVFQVFVERALENDQVLVALLKKLVPDRQHLEGEGIGSHIAIFEGLSAEDLRGIIQTCRKGAGEKRAL